MLTIFRVFDKGDDGPGCRAQKGTHSHLRDFQGDGTAAVRESAGGQQRDLPPNDSGDTLLNS